MRFTYADPPYIGQAKRRYGEDPRCAEVNHQQLIKTLERDYPDGWALSCSSPSLKQILGWCPEGVRVGSWVKPFHVFKPNVNPSYGWEPVIFKGGRKRTREQPTVPDWVAANITLRKGLCGAKPPDFCFWLFAVLNVQPGDRLEDLFPGTGVVGHCFDAFVRALPEPRHREGAV